MPYAWTHIIFGDKVLKKVGIEPPLNKELFHLGCQGPDFFFFYRFWPWLKSSHGTALGDLFHTVDCGPVLLDFIKKAKYQKSIREYVTGFVTHHILDRNTHPFIHYFAGYKKYMHQKLESTLDTLIAKKLQGIQTWKTPLVPKINVGKNLPKDVVESFFELASTYYPKEAKQFPIEEYHKAYQDMKKFLSITFDPYAIKLTLTGRMISPFRFTKNVPSKDYLNTKKKTWYHSANAKERHQESFWDLWNAALDEGATILNEVYRYWFNENESIDRLTELIKNISYDTGKDCALPIKNYVADPIV